MRIDEEVQPFLHSLKGYLKRGKILFQDNKQEINQLKDHLRNPELALKEKNIYTQHVFHVVHLPSGEGKTQLAFCLDEFVCFFLVSLRSGRPQDIYSNFLGVSELFQEAVFKDKVHFRGITAANFAKTLKSLYLFGLVLLLWRSTIKLNQVGSLWRLLKSFTSLHGKSKKIGEKK
jgi:hypothetical protein